MICRYCGREFESKKRGRMGQQYCSLSCSSKASRETFTTQRTCPVCGQTFTATTPQAVYCGEECQRRATRDREQAKRRRHDTVFKQELADAFALGRRLAS